MTTEERLARAEARVEEAHVELKRLHARLAEMEGGGLSAVKQVEIRELAREIHQHGWPERRGRRGAA